MKSKLFALVLILVLTALSFAQTPEKTEVVNVMKRATQFFSKKASIRGGYVWNISEDFSRHYGEIPARKSQIWVQSATPMVGMAYLDAYEATNDAAFLNAAKRAADALILGQHPTGGWHYMVDFEPNGVQQWYRSKASKFKWGMEEQRFFKNNASLDDGNSQNVIRFLLRLYLVSKDKKYEAPMRKGLAFLLKAQYPNGAFPQRYPLRYDYIHDGFPDYTSYYTLNDGAATTAIEVLVEAYEKLGDKRYLEAARRAVDFIIAVQGPEDQGCWAEQYHPDTMRPITARTHEPGGYVVRESEQVIEVLEMFYKMTGDKRYLRPIPLCLQWFDRLNAEAIKFNRPVARYYEVETNLPIYVVRGKKLDTEGHGLYDWSNTDARGNMQGLSSGWDNTQVRRVVNVDPIRKEYERLKTLDAKTARAEYEKSRVRPRLRPDPDAVSAMIKSIDPRGAWVTDCRVLKLDAGPDGMNSGDFEIIKGYSTGVFARNLSMMAAFLANGER